MSVATTSVGTSSNDLCHLQGPCVNILFVGANANVSEQRVDKLIELKIDLANQYQANIKWRQMMYTMPQVVPVSELRNHHRKVFGLLENGPIILAQRSKAAAVLVSVEEWDRRAKRLQELEWHEEIHRAAKAAKASTEPDLDPEEFMEELGTYHAGV